MAVILKDAPPVAGQITLKQSGQNNVVISMSDFTDDNGIIRYDVYYGDKKVGSTTGTSFTYKGSNLLGSMTFKVKAVDIMDAESEFASQTITIKDVTAPTVGSVTLKQTAPSSIKVSLSGFKDNVKVARYDIYVGSKKVGSTAGTSYTYTSSGISGKKTVTVKAYDAAGNVSKSASSVITLDKTAPTKGTFTLSQSGQKSIKISISGFKDNVKVTRYDIYVGSKKVGSTTGTSYTYTSSSNLLGKKTIGVKAYDATGRASAMVSKAITVKDVTAPKTGKITLAQTAANSVKISISGFTDNVKVTRYDIYVSGKKVASTTGTSYTYTSSSLTGSKTFGVKAADAAGKVSGTASAVITMIKPLTKTIGGIDSVTFEKLEDGHDCNYDSADHYKNCVPAAAKYGSVTGTKLADTVTFTAGKSRYIGTISLGDGNDKITLLDDNIPNSEESDVEMNGNLFLGNGNDRIYVGQSTSLDSFSGKVDFGAGNDTLSVAKYGEFNVESAVFGSGNDTAVFGEDSDCFAGTLDFGSGADKMTVKNDSWCSVYSKISFGDGNDTLDIDAGGRVVAFGNIDFGSGADTLLLDGVLEVTANSDGKLALTGLENISGSGTLAFHAWDGVDVDWINDLVAGTDIDVVNTGGYSYFNGVFQEQNDNTRTGQSVQTISRSGDYDDDLGFWLCGSATAAELDFGFTDSVDYVKYIKTSGDDEVDVGFYGDGSFTFKVLNASGTELTASKYKLSDGSLDVSKWANGTYYFKMSVASGVAGTGFIEID